MYDDTRRSRQETTTIIGNQERREAQTQSWPEEREKEGWQVAEDSRTNTARQQLAGNERERWVEERERKRRRRKRNASKGQEKALRSSTDGRAHKAFTWKWTGWMKDEG